MGNLTVIASGGGVGSLSAITRYYTKPDQNAMKCKDFDVDVKVTRMQTTSHADALASYTLSIDAIFLSKNREATMTVLDISLLTGFIPDIQDLEKLMQTDKFIQSFEMGKEFKKQGSLIIYLKKVSNKVKERIDFKMHQMFSVSLPQPAGITVYEYYSEEKPCVKFYDVTERTNGLLRTICPTEVCRCAEENCAQLKGPEVPDESTRTKEACSGTDFAYKATLKDVKRSSSTVTYTFTITYVLKEGVDRVDPYSKRDFLAHSQCEGKLGLEVGKNYLIMGPTPERVLGSLHYFIGARTWLEYWPTVVESQENKNSRERHIGLSELQQYLSIFGCPS